MDGLEDFAVGEVNEDEDDDFQPSQNSISHEEEDNNEDNGEEEEENTHRKRGRRSREEDMQNVQNGQFSYVEAPSKKRKVDSSTTSPINIDDDDDMYDINTRRRLEEDILDDTFNGSPQEKRSKDKNSVDEQVKEPRKGRKKKYISK
jgi:hypothetical protein